MLKQLDSLAERIEIFVAHTGRVFAWTTVLLMATILVQVVLRYVFSRDLVALGELQWHFYAAMVMVSFAYAQKEDAHVRVDLWHSHFTPRLQRNIEVIAILVLLLPLFLIVFWQGCQFTADAFRIGEKSPSPGGLPWRWAIKAFIPLGAGLLVLSSIARVYRLISGSVVVGSSETISHLPSTDDKK